MGGVESRDALLEELVGLVFQLCRVQERVMGSDEGQIGLSSVLKLRRRIISGEPRRRGEEAYPRICCAPGLSLHDALHHFEGGLLGSS